MGGDHPFLRIGFGMEGPAHVVSDPEHGRCRVTVRPASWAAGATGKLALGLKEATGMSQEAGLGPSEKGSPSRRRGCSRDRL